MNSREKVLRMLQRAGSRGVTTGEFSAAYQPRAGARIHELRQRGYRISTERESAGRYRYTLHAEPEKPREPAQPEQEPSPLFDAPPEPKRPSYLDPDMEEAA